MDPMGEHEGEWVCHSLDAFLAVFEQGLNEENSTIVVRDFLDADEYTDFLFAFLAELRDHCIMIDEVDRYAPGGPHLSRPVRALFNYRRHYGVSLISVARRPAAVHRDISALSSDFYLFHTHEKRDLDYIGWVCGREYMCKAANLPFFQHLYVKFPPEENSSEKAVDAPNGM